MQSINEKILQIKKLISEGPVEEKSYLLMEMKKIGIDKLPYSLSALKRFIDAKTMDFHYNKHYKGYVDKLNDALQKRDYGDLDLEQIVKRISKFNTTIRNNAGGAYNHALFWKMLSPTEQKPSKKIFDKIKKDFGSFAEFKRKFEDIAKKRFGSGWVWLILTKGGKLRVVSTPNQDNPLMNISKRKGFPILGLDLWEHAFYLKYQNKRDEYIKNFWSVVNWEFVEKLYDMKTNTVLQEQSLLKKLNLKTFINEGLEKAVSFCSYEQQQQYKDLLSVWAFKQKFVDRWKKLLKILYPGSWKADNELFQGHMEGVYTATNERSLLNNLTSSYMAFCILHNDINTYLKNSGEPVIIFNDDTKNNLVELDRFFDIMIELKDRIFNLATSKTFQKVEKTLKRNDCFGKRNEDAAMKIINKMWDIAECKIRAGGGLRTDMLAGVDAAIFLENGETWTAQIKPYKSLTYILADEKLIKIDGISFMKKYSVDVFVFVNVSTMKVYVIDNKLISHTSSTATFKETDIIKELIGDSDIELLDCSQYL